MGEENSYGDYQNRDSEDRNKGITANDLIALAIICGTILALVWLVTK